MPLETVADLVSLLQEHPLLEPAQLNEVRRALAARFPDPVALARELIQRNWLTPYQVNQLFQGRGADLVLGNYVLLTRLGEVGAFDELHHEELGAVDLVGVLGVDDVGVDEA